MLWDLIYTGSSGRLFFGSDFYIGTWKLSKSYGKSWEEQHRRHRTGYAENLWLVKNVGHLQIGVKVGEVRIGWVSWRMKMSGMKWTRRHTQRRKDTGSWRSWYFILVLAAVEGLWFSLHLKSLAWRWMEDWLRGSAGHQGSPGKGWQQPKEGSSRGVWGRRRTHSTVCRWKWQGVPMLCLGERCGGGWRRHQQFLSDWFSHFLSPLKEGKTSPVSCLPWFALSRHQLSGPSVCAGVCVPQSPILHSLFCCHCPSQLDS